MKGLEIYNSLKASGVSINKLAKDIGLTRQTLRWFMVIKQDLPADKSQDLRMALAKIRDNLTNCLKNL